MAFSKHKERAPLQRRRHALSRKVLVVSTMAGAEGCAGTIAESVGVEVELAISRAEGLLALRREDFAVVVMEESLTESDPAWARAMWEAAGLAMPLQVNFAISGCARLGREVKAALLRRSGDQAVARREVMAELESELKSSVTGLLLESELALQEPSVPASLEPKLRHLVELAGAIRERLRGEAA